MTPKQRKEIVQAKFKTIQAAADAIGTHRPLLSLVLAGKRKTVWIRARLAEAMGSTVAELFPDQQRKCAGNH